MNQLSLQSLAGYWSAPEVETNIVVFLNLLGALLLGLLVGYERSYHGRAAGMRTYGLVCMASAALTVIAGYPGYWYGGHVATAAVDPTRIIQGIVTGVGFLGAGVIMKEGFNITGLTTAASIWASSAIGILVGVGFYFSAMLLAAISAACMMWLAKIEKWLPSHPAMAITLRFQPGFDPQEESVVRTASERGYDIAPGSLTINYEHGRAEWRFVVIARRPGESAAISELAGELTTFEGMESYHLSHARN